MEIAKNAFESSIPEYGIYALAQSGGLITRKVIEQCTKNNDFEILEEIERSMREDFHITVS